MSACRSPSDAAPPSIFTLDGIGYGPRSDSSAYSNATRLLACVFPTTVIGIPIGPPSQRPEPKSGCSVFVGPIEAIVASEPAATGSVSTRRFHGLSAGKIGAADRLRECSGAGRRGGHRRGEQREQSELHGAGLGSLTRATRPSMEGGVVRG